MKRITFLGGLALFAAAAAFAGTPPPMDDYDWYDGLDLTVEGKAFADTETPYCRLAKDMKDKVSASIWRMSAARSVGVISTVIS